MAPKSESSIHGQPDHYVALGLSRDATARDIRAAFRGLAMKHHPDKAVSGPGKTGDAEKFLKIREAYEVLSDPKKRAIYNFHSSTSASSSEKWFADMDKKQGRQHVPKRKFAASKREHAKFAEVFRAKQEADQKARRAEYERELDITREEVRRDIERKQAMLKKQREEWHKRATDLYTTQQERAAVWVEQLDNENPKEVNQPRTSLKRERDERSEAVSQAKSPRLRKRARTVNDADDSDAPEPSLSNRPNPPDRNEGKEGEVRQTRRARVNRAAAKQREEAKTLRTRVLRREAERKRKLADDAPAKKKVGIHAKARNASASSDTTSQPPGRQRSA